MATMKEVQQSLDEQLALKGAARDCYKDLISDYMRLWKIKNELVQDIRRRGVVYKGLSANGVEQEKNNPSVKDLVLVNKQMLMLLKELGISTNLAGTVEDDDL